MLHKLLKTPWPALLWTVLIFILLTVNTGSMETTPFFWFDNLDKLVHAFLFATLAFLWVYRLDSQNRNTWLAVFIVASLYGMGMEFYQEYFTTREFEFKDILADAAGAIVGSLVGKKIGPYGNRGRNQN